MVLDSKGTKTIAYTLKIITVPIIDRRFAKMCNGYSVLNVFSLSNFVSKLLSFWPSMSMIILLGTS